MGMKRNGRGLEVFGSFCNSDHVKIPRGIARQFCRYSGALISKCSVNGHVNLRFEISKINILGMARDH